MAYNTISWALEQRNLKPGAKLVLLHHANCRNQSTGQCNPSQKTLSRLCEMTVSSINNHLRVLVEHGLVERVRQFDKSTGAARSTQYRFPKAPTVGLVRASRRDSETAPVKGIATPCLLEGP